MTRHLAIGKEVTYGTPVAYTKYSPYITESFGEDNQMLYAETVEARDIIKKRLGAYKLEGSINMFVEPENIGLLLLGLFGGVVSQQQGVTTAYKHTFKPAASLATLTLGIGSDVTGGEKKMTSCQVKKGEFSLVAGEFVSANFDIVAQTILLDALSTPTFSALEPFVFHQGLVEIAGSTDAYVKACKIAVENVINTDPSLNSRLLQRSRLEGLKVTGSLDIEFQALDNFKRFLGDAAAVAPANVYVEHPINMKVSGELADTPHKYEFNVLCPKCVFDSNKANVNKRDWTIQNLPFTAIYDVSSAYTVVVELQNKITSY